MKRLIKNRKGNKQRNQNNKENKFQNNTKIVPFYPQNSLISKSQNCSHSRGGKFNYLKLIKKPYANLKSNLSLVIIFTQNQTSYTINQYFY